MPAYKVKDQTVTIHQHAYQLRTLADRQQFSDDLDLAADVGISDTTWSLFGLIWPASKILASYVSEMPLRGKKVLEIGCGIGLSSIVLHRLGVDITASDYHPLAQQFLDANISRNGLGPIKFLNGNWEKENPLLGEYDLIIGSDVLYDPAHPQNVSCFIDRHLETDSAALIVDPDRGNRNQFTHLMQDMGYKHSFERFNNGLEDAQKCKGRILHYSRNPG